MASHDEDTKHLSAATFYLDRIQSGLLDGNGNKIGETFVENSVFSVFHFGDDYKILVFTNRDVTVYYKEQAVLVFNNYPLVRIVPRVSARASPREELVF